MQFSKEENIYEDPRRVTKTDKFPPQRRPVAVPGVIVVHG
jgi:hypothetical protein